MALCVVCFGVMVLGQLEKRRGEGEHKVVDLGSGFALSFLASGYK